MPLRFAALPLALAALLAAAPAARAQDVASLRPAADSLIHAATKDSAAYRRLGDLVDGFGNRLSGSASLERALDWILDQMHRDGLENVRGEPAMVPHWVRGSESAELVEPRPMPLRMLGLGNSVGTTGKGVTAPLLVVSTFDELARRAPEARGKIVLFDAPFVSYGETVRYRIQGPSAAAKAGAVACLIRSIASFSIRSPHTGVTIYDSTAPRIPAAALSVEDAMMLHRMSDRGRRVVVHLTMGARMLPDAPSRNAVAEIVGREKPDEVVVLGGHIDSWDVGQGAMDDGGGAVAAWEAVRLMQALGLRPRRTVRVVLWTNEENGGRGGLAYAAAHADAVGKHVLALESDEGVFRPRGFDATGTPAAIARMREIAALLAPIEADSVATGGGGADIEPLMAKGVPGAGLLVDGSRYFWYHHSDGDTLDKLDPADVARCVATLAVMAYAAAELPDGIPR
jgi:carboxypeptidase Q